MKERVEPHNRPKTNHLEVNYIAVGFYKHEIDFGVLCSVIELTDKEFDDMLDMLNTAVRMAREMRERNKMWSEPKGIGE